MSDSFVIAKIIFCNNRLELEYYGIFKSGLLAELQEMFKKLFWILQYHSNVSYHPQVRHGSCRATGIEL